MEIWKFKLTDEIEMPQEAAILYVQYQHVCPCIWALVEPKAKKEKRTFKIYGTGEVIEEINDNNSILKTGKYVGTYTEHRGAIVWHVIETT